MPHLVLVCRPGFEAALSEELALRFRGVVHGAEALRQEAGLVILAGGLARAVREPGPGALLFARQWLPDAQWVPLSDPAAAAEAVVAARLTRLPAGQPWTLHAFGASSEGDLAMNAAATRLADAVLHACRAQHPALLEHYVEPRDAGKSHALVLQLCIVSAGVWASLAPGTDLPDAYPGGVHRMRFDPQSPSRSYLKIEEAFDVLGTYPRTGERVIDLGAAPGGWTYAFLKRGCQVLAVDRGPLKLRSTGSGHVTHVREDGLTFQPPHRWGHADWLVSDMLVPPGKTFGLLRRWIEQGGMRRFVVNIKIPQQHPYPVLQPIEDYLRRNPDLWFRIRQLYHDRREVTVVGRFSRF